MTTSANRKAQTRNKVLVAAAREIRVVGPEKVSVAGVMAKAGLTHGGFYAHFASKDELIAKAVPVMFDDTYGLLFLGDLTHGVPPALVLSNFIERYLSVEHRDHPERGCPIPSLSGELARLPLSRAAFAAGAKRLAHAIRELIVQFQPNHADESAISVLAELVGALAFARAVGNDTDSFAVLEASRQELRRRLQLPPPTVNSLRLTSNQETSL